MANSSRCTSLLRGVVWTVALVTLFIFAGCFAPFIDSALADPETDAQKVAVFESITIGEDEVWDNVVVVFGNADVQGTIQGNLVVVGGNITLGPQAKVGTNSRSETIGNADTAMVSVFGSVEESPGSVVYGHVVNVGINLGDGIKRVFVNPMKYTWNKATIIDWSISGGFLFVLSLIITLIAPRHVGAIRNRVKNNFLESFGWGVLSSIIFVPLITILLCVTVVGIIVVFPWLIMGLPLIWLFAATAVCAWLGSFVLRKDTIERGYLIAQVVIGFIFAHVIRLIPWAGAVVFVLLVLVGFGATFAAIWDRFRGRSKKTPPMQQVGA